MQNESMKSVTNIRELPIADAWSNPGANLSPEQAIEPNANRLAFADPEFLLRRETRGIRFQLEMLKPDLIQEAHHIDSTVVVFGSARFKSHEEAASALDHAQLAGDPTAIASAERLLKQSTYYEAARAFANVVASYSEAQADEKDKLFICTGGGPGIMEAANRGASEAGAPTVGLNITLPHEQHANPYVTPELSFQFHYFALRKMHFMLRAKALVAFPGGFGTLDELFEVITLVQCKKASPTPIVLFGSDYWKRLINLDMLVEEGTIAAEDLSLITYADDVHDAWRAITRFYNLRPVIKT